MRSVCNVLLLTVCGMLAACGGGGSSATITTPPPTAVDRVAELEAALATLPVDDYAVVIGDADGVLIAREYGSVTIDDSYLIASATKWLAAMIIMDLVEQGVMSLNDQPHDYLGWWTADPSDPRSEITLEQLLSFTAGFDTSPDDLSCVSDGSISLDDCARAFYDDGLAYAPGTTFHYGPAHLQVAGRMAEVAAGLPFADLAVLQQNLRFGLQRTAFLVPVGDNPRIGGGAVASARDYGLLLEAILDGRYLSGVIDTMVQARTGPPVIIGERPASIDNNNVDFRYALGHWRECDQPAWDASCDSEVVVSSPGAFGWNPWIDFENRYFAIVAMREADVEGGSPATASVRFGLEIRPAIEAALDGLRAQR